MEQEREAKKIPQPDRADYCSNLCNLFVGHGDPDQVRIGTDRFHGHCYRRVLRMIPEREEQMQLAF